MTWALGDGTTGATDVAPEFIEPVVIVPFVMAPLGMWFVVELMYGTVFIVPFEDLAIVAFAPIAIFPCIEVPFAALFVSFAVLVTVVFADRFSCVAMLGVLDWFVFCDAAFVVLALEPAVADAGVSPGAHM